MDCAAALLLLGSESQSLEEPLEGAQEVVEGGSGAFDRVRLRGEAEGAAHLLCSLPAHTGSQCAHETEALLK